MPGYSKFSPQMKQAIREAVEMGTPIFALASEHDVSSRTIHRVIRGHSPRSSKTATVKCKCGTLGERFRKREYVREYCCSDCQHQKAEVRDARKAKSKNDDGCSLAKLRSVGLRPEPERKVCKACAGKGTKVHYLGREVCGRCNGWGYERPGVR